MDENVIQIVIQLAMLLIAAASIVYMLSHGYFMPGSFRESPIRKADLVLADIAIAMCIMLVGSAALRSVFELLGIPIEEPGGPPVSLTDRQFAWKIIASQCLTQVPIAIFILLKVARVSHGLRELGAVPRHWARELRMAGVALVMAFSITFMVSGFCLQLTEMFGMEMPESGHHMLGPLTQSRDSTAVILLWCSAVVIAPICEEFMFRGLLQTSLLNFLGEHNRWTVILVSAVIFAAVHFGSAPWQSVVGLLAFGVILGWLYEKTGSLWPSILVHMFFNVTNILLATLVAK